MIDWGASNGVSVIKSNLKFRLGTGEVDRLCYNTSLSEDEDCFLNRYGVIRLLDAIDKQCTVFDLSENWDSIIRQITATPYISRNQSDHKTQRQMASDSWRDRADNSRPIARTNHQSRLTARTSAKYGNAEVINNRDYNDNQIFRYGNKYSANQEDPYMSTFPTWRRNSRQQAYQRDPRQHRSPSPDMRPPAFHRTQPTDPRAGPTWETRRYHRPCHNCGEMNHGLSECRIQRRVKCNNCNEYGHKTKLCNNRI